MALTWKPLSLADNIAPLNPLVYPELDLSPEKSDRAASFLTTVQDSSQGLGLLADFDCHLKPDSHWPSDINSFVGAMMLPNATRLFRDGFAMDPSFASLLDDLDHSCVDQLPARVASCLIARCSFSFSCSSDAANCNPSTLIKNGSLVWDSTIACLDRICIDAPYSKTNTDLGGIGVRIAYFLQNAIASSMHLGLWLVTTWVNYLQRQGRSSRDATLRESQISGACHGSSGPKRTTLVVLDTVRQAMLLSLVDFHKAQCYFALAIAIALLVEFRTAPDTLADPGLNSTWLIVAAATVPILCHYRTIRLYHKPSTYISSLTFVTCAVGYSLYWVVSLSAQFRIWQSESLDEPLTCARSPAWMLCKSHHGAKFSQVDGMFLAKGGISFTNIAVFTMFAFGALAYFTKILGKIIKAAVRLLTALLRSPPGSIPNQTSERTERNSSPARHKAPFWKRHERASALLGVLARAWLLTLYALQFFLLRYSLLVGKEWQVDLSEWSFGQVVSITAWLPVLVDMVYHSVCCMRNDFGPRSLPKAMNYRLPRPWILVKSAEDGSSAAGDTADHEEAVESQSMQCADCSTVQPRIVGRPLRTMSC